MHDQMGNNRHIKKEVTLQAFAYFKYIYVTEFKKGKHTTN